MRADTSVGALKVATHRAMVALRKILKDDGQRHATAHSPPRGRASRRSGRCRAPGFGPPRGAPFPCLSWSARSRSSWRRSTVGGRAMRSPHRGSAIGGARHRFHGGGGGLCHDGARLPPLDRRAAAGAARGVARRSRPVVSPGRLGLRSLVIVARRALGLCPATMLFGAIPASAIVSMLRRGAPLTPG